MEINNQFKIGQAAYLKTDEEQKKRMITGIVVRHYGLLYFLSYDTTETVHCEFEISDSIDMEMKLNISSNG